MAERPEGPLVLDTHVWIWMVEGERGALSETAVETIEEAGRRGAVRVSAISVWEVAMLETRGRITLSRPLENWVRAALRAPGIRLLPLSPEIAIASIRLPRDPHGDPSDRMLIASARVTGGRLATCDQGILDYSTRSGLAVLDARP